MMPWKKTGAFLCCERYGKCSCRLYREMYLVYLYQPKTTIPFKSVRLACLFTQSSTSNQPNHQVTTNRERQTHQVPITELSYWTKKIHNLCTRDRNVDDALRLLDSLRLRGYRPNGLNISSIIHALCDDNRFAEAHHRLAIFLASSCVPDERTCNILIARLLDYKTPFETLSVFWRLIDVKSEFVPSLVNYNRLIYQLCLVSGRPDVGHRLYYDMISRGHCPSVVTYTTLVDGYCRVGEMGDAFKLFDQMRDSGEVMPNSLTWSLLIRGVIRKRDVERGKGLMSELWEIMKSEKNQSVNSAAFANLIDSLCREGFFNEIFVIAEEMRHGDSVNKEFAYGVMIDSLCRAGRCHGASRIVYIMRKRGSIPSLISYNSIVHGLCKEGGCMRAYQLLKEGIEFGYWPSEYTYKTLVEALCQAQDLDKASDVLQCMLNKEGVDRTRMHNIYLRALSAINNPTELLNVLVSMLQNNCQPDVITLNTVINGFCKMGRMEEALKILNDMMNGKFCAPDAVTFTSIISGLLSVGKSQEAHDLLCLMLEKGNEAGVVTYNAILRGLFRLELVNEAMGVFNSMITEGVAADCTTYTIIIQGLCKSDQLEKAKKFWDEIIWPSKVHDDFVYAEILKGLCRLGSFNEACHFLYELVDSGVNPNIFSYNILIDSACRSGMKREAYQIVGEMRKNGLVPDAVTWRILDKLHAI